MKTRNIRKKYNCGDIEVSQNGGTPKRMVNKLLITENGKTYLGYHHF
jgi:hypothetical protein